MNGTVLVNYMKGDEKLQSKNLSWPQKYKDFLRNIIQEFGLNNNASISLRLVTQEDGETFINSQENLDNFLEDSNYIFNFFVENDNPNPDPPHQDQNPIPVPKPNILEINIDGLVSEIFENDTFKKVIEQTNNKIFTNFKSELELSINNIIEKNQKVIENNIDLKLKDFIDDFSEIQNENKNLALELKSELSDIKDQMTDMNSELFDIKKSIINNNNNNNNNNNHNNNNNIIINQPESSIKFEQKRTEKIIDMKDAKFFNIDGINIINIGKKALTQKNLSFIIEPEKSSKDLYFFGNSQQKNEYILSMNGELKPRNSLNCSVSMCINNPKPGKEYKIIIYVKEKGEKNNISDPFEIMVRIKQAEDPMIQIKNQANKIYEDIKNQFPNHQNLINQEEIINKLIQNNLNKNEIINEIKNKIKEIKENEENSRAEQMYKNLSLDKYGIDKNEAIKIIKEKKFDNEEIKNWSEEKRARILYNNLRNDEELDFSKCPNEEEIIKKIIELNLNENEIREFFKKDDGKEELVNEIFKELEDTYEITGIVTEEKAKAKIRKLKFDMEKIIEWADNLVVNGDEEDEE